MRVEGAASPKTTLLSQGQNASTGEVLTRRAGVHSALTQRLRSQESRLYWVGAAQSSAQRIPDAFSAR